MNPLDIIRQGILGARKSAGFKQGIVNARYQKPKPKPKRKQTPPKVKKKNEGRAAPRARYSTLKKIQDPKYRSKSGYKDPRNQKRSLKKR